MKIRHLFVAALLLGTGQAMAQQPLYKQANAPIEERIKDLMERMTVEEKVGQNALEVFQESLENLKPQLEVKARRVGGSTYQVPMEVRPERQQTLALRWLINYSRNRSERTMAERLAGEIMDAKNSMGGAFKKKEETHRMAEANKAFAHYRY